MREIKAHKAAANLGLFAQVSFGWQDVGVSKESLVAASQTASSSAG